jgi:hypothetical protein
MTPRESSKATRAWAASVAYPRPCQSTPTTQAISARVPPSTIVAWT